ncbi:alpha-isopropylmalate synthase regulatory domain-containing protein, partial [Mycobacterium arosiense]
NEYLKATSPYVLASHRLQEENGTSAVDLEVSFDGEKQHWRGIGKGPLEALVAALPVKAEIMDYHEHAIGAGANAKAAAYIE